MKRLLLLLLAVPQLAHAGAWTKDQGHFYINTSYSRISTNHLYAADFSVQTIQPYTQQTWNIFGEVGIVSRWLTATIEGTLLRRNEIRAQGATLGLGDFRLGAWTGAIVKPVRLSFGVTLGIPTGDAHPTAGPGADSYANLIANSLPTGDGEWDVEGRASLGYSFGGVKRWPVVHYLVVEAGYWLRTGGFADAFVGRAEVGTKFPFKFIERFWFVWRFVAVVSFASQAEAARDATGLGNGVTYLSPGIEVYGRIWRGLGASFGFDGAVKNTARSVAAGSQIKLALSYQW